MPLPFLRLAVAAVLWAGALAMGGCASLPSDGAKAPSFADIDTSATRLSRAVASRTQEHQSPPRSGFVALPDGYSAFAVRMLLADAAERTLDVQTYIWRLDATGTMLFDAMRRAALRGVRVRLLLDDANTSGLDPVLAMLASQPNLEVRLYNPFASRGRRGVAMMADFSRLHRRMHNKSFTADGVATLVGGRNIGDEYFEASPEGNFVDNDVIAIGPASREVSVAFDRYWNSVPVFTAAALLRDVAPIAPTDFAEKVAAVRDGAAAEPYVAAIMRTVVVRELLSGSVTFDWAASTLVYDEPEKVLHPPGTRELQMLPRLLEAMGTTRGQLDLVSPYFVPDDEAVELLTGLARRGVAVRVLTNSLASSDVAAVHAGYARKRETLLAAGVRIYELKAVGGAKRREDKRDEAAGSSVSAGSTSSLHAKNIAADRERAFVGSFNLDPRSKNLNTEMGLVVASPALAARVSDALDARLPRAAYEVRLGEDGRLRWLAAGEPPRDSEPDASAWRRFQAGVFQLMPFMDWLL